jgi:hypothetical protein
MYCWTKGGTKGVPEKGYKMIRVQNEDEGETIISVKKEGGHVLRSLPDDGSFS